MILDGRRAVDRPRQASLAGLGKWSNQKGRGGSGCQEYRQLLADGQAL